MRAVVERGLAYRRRQAERAKGRARAWVTWLLSDGQRAVGTRAGATCTADHGNCNRSCPLMLWLGAACRQGASPAVIGRAANTHLCSGLKARKPRPKRAQCADPLREICATLSGPCRPPARAPALDPRWRTDTVVAVSAELARTGRADGFGVLADALQDAGCDRNEVLQHLRAPVERHNRDCWVLDWLRGDPF